MKKIFCGFLLVGLMGVWLVGQNSGPVFNVQPIGGVVTSASGISLVSIVSESPASLKTATITSIYSNNITATISPISPTTQYFKTITFFPYHGYNIQNSGTVWFMNANDAGGKGAPLLPGGSLTITANVGERISTASLWFTNEVAGDGFYATGE
jgi:hypothetical protein